MWSASSTLQRQRQIQRHTTFHQYGIARHATCKCGQLETVKHFLLDCKLHDVARLQLYEKLGGLLENRVSTYSKSKLCEILLYGEKPEMLEKYTHNKFIFLSVQKFIYTVHRYHFVNDPYDLWLSLQNISNLVSKILLFSLIFVILYRPSLLTIRFDIDAFDNLDWQLDPLF